MSFKPTKEYGVKKSRGALLILLAIGAIAVTVAALYGSKFGLW